MRLVALLALLASPAAALGVVAGSAAHADEPAKPVEAKPAFYRVLLRERWKAGDVATRTVKEVTSSSMEVKQGDAEPRVLPKTVKQTSYVAVLRCLEADAEGYATKFLLYLTAWSVEIGADRDMSLAGVHVELLGRGALRTWRILTPDAKPTESAKAWLEQNFGKITAADQTNADLEPKGLVAVGATWDGDAVAIAGRIAARGMPVDVEKAKASVTLVGVEDGKARLKVALSLPTTALLLAGGQTLPWKEGGAVEMNVDIVRPLLAGLFDATTHREQRMSGTATGDNATVTREDEVIQDIEIATGGKMPPAPEAATAPAPAMDEAAPKGDGK